MSRHFRRGVLSTIATATVTAGLGAASGRASSESAVGRPKSGTGARGNGRRSHSRRDRETYTGVVDRITAGLATVLLERGGETVDQIVIDVERLPKPARDDGAVLVVELDGDAVVGLRYDPWETMKRRCEIRERLDDLFGDDEDDDTPPEHAEALGTCQ